MSETSWPPGPWDVDQYGDVIANGEDVAHVVSTIGDHIATARLIAAAPELYQALNSLYDSYKELADSGDSGWWKLEDQDEGKQALAAIAKARGES